MSASTMTPARVCLLWSVSPPSLVNLSLPLSAIYTAPEWRCRVPAYRDMICRANRKRTMIPAPLQNIFDRLAVAWHERAIALKAVSFALVGVVNTAIDFSVFWTTATLSALAAGAWPMCSPGLWR